MSKVNMNVKRISNSSVQVNNVNRTNNTSFEDVLSRVGKKELTISKHAKLRLNQRNISLTDNDIKKIDKAIEKAGQKGIKDALILMDNKAFVANVKNNTIITASTNEKLEENVFTNIDGAVIV